MIKFAGVLGLLPAPRFAREHVATETAVLKLATLISCPVSGSPYEHLQAACQAVVSHYPQPARETLEKLYVDVATYQPTPLAHDFYREYCKKG